MHHYTPAAAAGTTDDAADDADDDVDDDGDQYQAKQRKCSRIFAGRRHTSAELTLLSRQTNILNSTYRVGQQTDWFQLLQVCIMSQKYVT